MANPNGPPDQYKFKPGNPGGGRPKGLLRRDDIQALMGRFWKLTREELHVVVQNPKSTMGEIMVASVMARAAKDGDANRLAFLLDRTVGKPTVDAADVVRRDLEELTNEQLIARLEKDLVALKKSA